MTLCCDHIVCLKNFLDNSLDNYMEHTEHQGFSLNDCGIIYLSSNKTKGCCSDKADDKQTIVLCYQRTEYFKLCKIW